MSGMAFSLGEGVFGAGATIWGDGESFRGVRDIWAFRYPAACFGLAAIVLVCPTATDFCRCFEACAVLSGSGPLVGGRNGLDFCTDGLVGESLTLFLLSVSIAIAVYDPLLAVAFGIEFFIVLGAAFGASLGVGGVASSSLEGTSKTLALSAGEKGGVLDGDVRVILFSFFESAGVMLGDLDAEG